MITKIKTKGFLGPSINQVCKEKMFFIGPNRSGKTTRTNAIHLCLNGFVSTAHRVSKKPGNILEQYSSGDKLTCSIEINKTEFEITISKNSEGKVSKRFRVDKKKYSEKEYMSELVLAGNPKIIDLESFIQMSDGKKIDQLFKLYPANIDFKKLNSDIDKKETAIKRMQADIKTKKAVIKENTKSKQAIELPGGSLVDIKKELEDHKIAYRGTRDKLTEIKAKNKQSALDNQKKDHSQCFKNEINEPSIPGGTFIGVNENQYTDNSKPKSTNLGRAGASFEIKANIQFLEKILTIMNESGCNLCTASMVIKKEIRSL